MRDQGKTTMLIRVPDQLKEASKLLASKKRWTLTTLINVAIEEKLEREGVKFGNIAEPPQAAGL